MFRFLNKKRRSDKILVGEEFLGKQRRILCCSIGSLIESRGLEYTFCWAQKNKNTFNRLSVQTGCSTRPHSWWLSVVLGLITNGVIIIKKTVKLTLIDRRFIHDEDLTWLSTNRALDMINPNVARWLKQLCDSLIQFLIYYRSSAVKRGHSVTQSVPL